MDCHRRHIEHRSISLSTPAVVNVYDSVQRHPVTGWCATRSSTVDHGCGAAAVRRSYASVWPRCGRIGARPAGMAEHGNDQREKGLNGGEHRQAAGIAGKTPNGFRFGPGANKAAAEVADNCHGFWSKGVGLASVPNGDNGYKITKDGGVDVALTFLISAICPGAMQDGSSPRRCSTEIPINLRAARRAQTHHAFLP